nr:uncharacterized protein LOC123767392 [Procambarus clarkii]
MTGFAGYILLGPEAYNLRGVNLSTKSVQYLFTATWSFFLSGVELKGFSLLASSPSYPFYYNHRLHVLNAEEKCFISEEQLSGLSGRTTMNLSEELRYCSKL